MALTFEDQNSLAQNGVFKNNVRQAMLTVAAEVQKENPDPNITFNIVARLSLARSVIRQPQQTAETAAYLLATDSVLSNQNNIKIDDAFAIGIGNGPYLSTVRERWNDMTGESTYQ